MEQNISERQEFVEEEIEGEPAILRPSRIRFTHKYIAPCFRDDNELIEEVANDVISGKRSLDIYLPLLVFQMDGHFYTWFNQKLYLLRLLECRGVIKAVECLIVSHFSIGLSPFTSECNGLRTNFREGSPQWHGPINVESCDEDDETIPLITPSQNIAGKNTLSSTKKSLCEKCIDFWQREDRHEALGLGILLHWSVWFAIKYCEQSAYTSA
ncbi:uncharacterized protein LOC143449604 [Clavelina lepadiformis]|uniref:uncharacterized protein LOC143449604 n=1 Tax=Clavelina lepadiformis TaxID=159417 RepID=UPI0040420497